MRLQLTVGTLCLAAAAALSAGCSSVSTEKMIPVSAGTVVMQHAKSIRVGSVTGNKEEFFGGPEMINAEEFRTVLTATFVRSKLFSSVETAAADLEISARFLAHGQVSKGFDVEQAMVIEYAIVDLQTGKEIWKKPINSRFAVKLSEKWGGAARTRMAQEGCVRNNLDQLVASLNTLKFE